MNKTLRIFLTLCLGISGPSSGFAWEAPLPAAFKVFADQVRVKGVFFRYEGRGNQEAMQVLIHEAKRTCPALLKRPMTLRGDASKITETSSMVYVMPGVTTSWARFVTFQHPGDDACVFEIVEQLSIQQQRWNGTHTEVIQRDLSTGKVRRTQKVGRLGLLEGLPEASGALGPAIKGHEVIQGLRCARRELTQGPMRMESCALDDDRVDASLQGHPLHHKITVIKGDITIMETKLVAVELDALIPKGMTQNLSNHALFKD